MAEQDAKTGSRKATVLIIVVLAVIAFLGGYVPMYLKNQDLGRALHDSEQQVERAQDELARVQRRLDVARLRNELGMMIIQLEGRDFEAVKARSTKFFNDLRQTAFATQDSALREALMAMLDQRDEITSDLTSQNPETVAKLRTLYTQFPQPGAASQSP